MGTGAGKISTGLLPSELGMAGSSARTIIVEFWQGDFSYSGGKCVFSFGDASNKPRTQFTLLSATSFRRINLQTYSNDYNYDLWTQGGTYARVFLGITYDGGTQIKVRSHCRVFLNDGTPQGVVSRSFTSSLAGPLATGDTVPLDLMGGGTYGFQSMNAQLFNATFIGGRALTEKEIDNFYRNPQMIMAAAPSFPYAMLSDAVVTTLVSANLSAAYSVRGTVNKDLAPSYAVRGAVATNLPAAYSVFGAVGANAAGDYRILASVTRSLAADYAVRTALAKDLTTDYRVLAAVAKDVTANYAVYASVSNDLFADYQVLSSVSVTTSLSASYRVLGAVNKDLAPSYAVRDTVGQTLAPAYAVRETVAREFSAAYKVVAAVRSDLLGIYSVYAAIIPGIVAPPKRTVVFSSAQGREIVTKAPDRTIVFKARNRTVKFIAMNRTVEFTDD